MAIRYRFSKRKNPLNTNEVQHILQAVSKGTVDVETIAYEISNERSLSPVDVHAFLMVLGTKIQMHLGDGKIVDLDHLGKYKIGSKCKSEPAANLLIEKSIEKFYLNKPKFVRLIFYYCLVLIIVLYGGKQADFIYFQF